MKESIIRRIYAQAREEVSHEPGYESVHNLFSTGELQRILDANPWIAEPDFFHERGVPLCELEAAKQRYRIGVEISRGLC